MKKIKFRIWLIIALFLKLQIFSSYLFASEQASVAFFYGSNIPTAELSVFDQVVLEPGHATPQIIQQLKNKSADVFAYLSVGEVEKQALTTKKIAPSLMIGHNPHWKSVIIDQSAKQWHDILLNQRIPPLIKAGFNGLFLDTLDSYQSVITEKKERLAQIKGQLSLIKAIKHKYPNLKLFANRGFELFPQVAPYLSGVAAESLFQTFEFANPIKFRKTTIEEQSWLLKKLDKVRKYNIPVTIIDYMPTEAIGRSSKLIQRIKQKGFTPWISTPNLDVLGTGLLTPKSRKVIMLYNGQESLGDTLVHSAMAVITEYLGLIPEYVHIDNQLPDYPLKGRYAGIISWLTEPANNQKKLDQWLVAQLDAEIPILFMDNLPTASTSLLSRLGIKRIEKPLISPASIKKKSEYIGTFEIDIQLQQPILNNIISTDKKHKIALSLQDHKQTETHPILITTWGGLALSPFTLYNNGSTHQQWQLNPFSLVQQALKLEVMPIPDTSTENGLRIMTSHIDGDGFASRAEMPSTPFSGEVIKDKILTRYNIPHSVSIIEGEVANTGLNPELSTQLEPIAKAIFKLPNVEIASHSYSHPFYWVTNDISSEDTLYGFHLPIKGYPFSLEREIKGSVNYINKKLAPPNKTVKAFFWTGDARPDHEALSLVKDIKLLNINGGNSIITQAFPSITGLSPHGKPTKAGWQIYAPIMNENVYTNDWTGPFYGYKKVIETFKLTETPRRLKPVSFYWHFYSGTKFSSLNALKDAYDWALKQPLIPLYISEYIPKVEGFYSAQLSQDTQGNWHINHLGKLRTVRSDSKLGFPSPWNSDNIAGFVDLPQGRYIHLTDENVRLNFTLKKPDEIYLEKANGQVLNWQYKNKKEVALRIAGHKNIEFTIISSRKTCRLKNAATSTKATAVKNRHYFKLNGKDTGRAILVCQ